MKIEIIYSPRRGYGVRTEGVYFYDFRFKPTWPRGMRSPEGDETAVRWFRKELMRPRARLASYAPSSVTPIGSAVVYTRESRKDQ